MKITTAKKHLINAYNKKVACMIWGAPGVGKSSIVKQAAQELGVSLIDLRLPQLEPPDLRGIPAPNRESKKAEWFLPEFLPESGNGILFLDEIEKAPVAVKNAALQLVLDRKIGSYTLPPGWGIIAAGNREEDGCFSAPLGSALCNRMIHFQVQPDLDAWIEWGRKHGIRDEIFGYLAFRPDHLYKYDVGENAFPSPRSWEMLNTMLVGVENQVEINELLEAVVGKVVGTEYRAWYTVYKNINVENIVLAGEMPNFNKIEKGKEKSFIYAVTTAVAHYVKKHKNFDKIEENTSRFVSFLEPEMRTVFCKQIPTQHLARMIESKAFRPIAEGLMKIIFGV